jgi:hypothetical protein
MMIYADCANIMDERIHFIEKNSEAFLVAL